MYPLVCGAGIKIHNLKINSHDMILNIKLTGCSMFLTFVSLKVGEHINDVLKIMCGCEVFC